MHPEFSRPVSVKSFFESGEVIEIVANVEERKALALRFDVPGIEFLSARFCAEKAGSGMYHVTGQLNAHVQRTCVRTLETLTERVDQSFEVRCVERALFDTLGEGHEEEPIDLEVIEAETIDLGELAAQYLSLLMDPYPHSVETSGLAVADPPAEIDAGPFAVLKKIKKEP